MDMAKVEILHEDGRREEREVGRRGLFEFIRETIAPPQGLDTVNLRDGRVLVVDDTGMVDGRPVNVAATALYHAVCRPGTVYEIHGTACVARDEDFE